VAATAMDVAVLVRDATPAVVERTLRDFLAGSSKPSEYDLARHGSKPVFEKHDRLLSPGLLGSCFRRGPFTKSSRDLLVIYFSGHTSVGSDGVWRWLMYDSRAGDDGGPTQISSAEVNALLKKSGAQAKAVFID
jgi:hypothetical protein